MLTSLSCSSSHVLYLSSSTLIISSWRMKIPSAARRYRSALSIAVLERSHASMTGLSLITESSEVSPDGTGGTMEGCPSPQA